MNNPQQNKTPDYPTKKGSFSVLVKIGGYGFIEKKGAVNGARNKKYGGLRKVRTPIIAPPSLNGAIWFRG